MWSWFMFLTREPENKSWRTGTTRAEIFPLGGARANRSARWAPRLQKSRCRDEGDWWVWVWGGCVRWRKQMDDLRGREETELMEMKIMKGRQKKYFLSEIWRFSKGLPLFIHPVGYFSWGWRSHVTKWHQNKLFIKEEGGEDSSSAETIKEIFKMFL